MTNRISSALGKVSDALSGVDPAQVGTACQMIADADTLGVYGCGREGYQMRGFTMRLFHMGQKVGYVGETTMPPLASGAVFVVSSGPDDLSTVAAHIATARAAGARVIVLTAQPVAPDTVSADLVLTVPAQTMTNDAQTSETDILPMGSVYEAALFFCANGSSPT